MYEFLIQKLLTISKSVHVLGSYRLTQYILYSEIIALLWRILNWTLGIFTIQFQLHDNEYFSSIGSHFSHIFLSTYSYIGYFIDLCKVLVVITLFFYKVDSPSIIKKILVICFVMFEDNCFMGDMVTTKHYMGSKAPAMIAYNVVSFVLCASIRLFSDLAMCNFSFLYPHLSKRIPLIKLKMVQMLTQQVTCLFLMFVPNIQEQGYFIVYVILSLCSILARGNYLYSLPFVSMKITKLRMVKYVIWTSFTLSSILSYSHLPLVTSNIWIMYVTFSVLGFVVSLNYLKMTREKTLDTEIKSLPSWRDANIKLQYAYEIITEEKISNSKIISLFKSHNNFCKLPDCYCHSQDLYDFRGDSARDMTKLKYFLLIICNETSEHFVREFTPKLFKLFGYSLLNIYPKVLSLCHEFMKNQDALRLNDKVLVEYTKWEIVEFLEERNVKDRVLKIEELERLEELHESLIEGIKRVSKYRYKIFENLNQSEADEEVITRFFEEEINEREKLAEIFNQVECLPYKLPHITQTILVYSKYIVEDYHLFKKFLNEAQEKLKYTSLYSDTQTDAINSLTEKKDRTILIKVSLHDVGRIEWHSPNLLDLCNLPSSISVVGQNIQIFIPSFYKQSFAKIINHWKESPHSSILNQHFEGLLEFKEGMLQLASVYLKLLPLNDSEPVVFGVITLEEETDIILLNQSLDMMNYCEYLFNELKEHEKEFSSPLNFGLVSLEVIDIVEKGGYTSYETEFNLFVPQNYEVYYQNYETEMNKLDFREEKYPERYFQLLRSQYLEMTATETVSIISFKGVINSIDTRNIPIPKEILSPPQKFIYIKNVSAILQNNQEEEHLSYASEQSLVSDTQSQNCFINNPSSSYSERVEESYSKLLKSKEFLQNKTFRLVRTVIILAFVVYAVAPYFSLLISILNKIRIDKIYDANIAICRVASVCMNTYDMNTLMDYQLQHQLPYNHNLKTILDFEIGNLAEYIKIYSYQNDNEILKGFFSKNVGLENGSVLPFSMWMQNWIYNMKELSKQYSNLESGTVSNVERKSLNLSFYKGSFLSGVMAQYKQNYDQLLLLNNVLSALTVAAGLLGLGFYIYYIIYFRDYQVKTMKLLEQIDLSTIGHYLDFYRYCKKNSWNIENQKEICFSNNDPPKEIHPQEINQKKVVAKPKLRGRSLHFRAWHLIFFLVLAIVVNQLLTKQIRERATYSTALFTQMIEFQRSQWYNVRSLSQLREVTLKKREVKKAEILTYLVSNDFNQNSVSMKGVLLSKRLDQSIIKYFTTSVCEIIQPLSDPAEVSVCLNAFSDRVIDIGILSFQDYVTNNIRQFFNKPSLLPSDLFLNPKLTDSTISFFFHQKITQQINRDQVRKRIDRQLSLIIRIVCEYLGVSSVLCVLIALSLGRMLREERRKWRIIFQLPQLLPEKMLKENGMVESFFSRFKKENRVKQY